jgi:hypothetical protein
MGVTKIEGEEFCLRDIMSFSPLKYDLRFGGTCRLHLQGRRISRARNQHESTWQAALCLTPGENIWA